MTAPFPREAAAGAKADPMEAEALNLYRHYAWLARLADEMHREVELDLKRTMQLVQHAREFQRWHDALTARDQARAANILEGIFAAKQCRWPSPAEMAADIAVLHAAAGKIADWIETNAAEYRQGFSVNKVVSPGVMTDDPIKRPKPAGIAGQLADFRGLFGAKE